MGLTASNGLRALTDKICYVPKEKKKKEEEKDWSYTDLILP